LVDGALVKGTTDGVKDGAFVVARV
jgi:hypothetical protein